MKRVFVNEKWCLGCRLCEYNCAFANTGERNMALALRNLEISPRIRIEQDNDICFAVSCRHCEEPLCVKGCITGALSIKDGVIMVDEDRCVSCYTCILSCPYGAVSPSEHGAVQKCELCVKNRTGAPACVAGCPHGAIVYEER
jgi:carbon-monoxide dehydrogenase iron sulfur subunit